MSAFLSAQDSNSIALISDGAGYFPNGIIATIEEKIMLAAKAPLAVTSRGNHFVGKRFQKRICDLADNHGIDMALEMLANVLPDIKCDPKYHGEDCLHLHIAAYSDTRGLVRMSFHNLPEAFADGEEPGKLIEVTGTYSAGNALVASDLETIPARRPGEAVAAYMERAGADIFEAMRRKPANLLHGETGVQYLIGGHVDLAVVRPSGATMKRLRTWPDKVGACINPSGASNVFGMNRKQRRAANSNRKVA